MSDMDKVSPAACGATRDFGKGTELAGLLVAECIKPLGHDIRSWHKAEHSTLYTPGGPVPKGGCVEWNGDDRDQAA